MRQEKMQLTLAISPTMDKWAQRNKAEHQKIRLSKRARVYYRPSDWKTAFITIHGKNKTDKLRIGQAIKTDVKKHTPEKSKRLGFVTTETYNKLMGKDKESIWISEKTHQITIGCDPEFVVTSLDGASVYGDTAMGYAFSDPAKKAAKVGSDGPCVELRPDPEDNPEGLVKNIKSLLQNGTSKIQDYVWVGGASYRDKTMSRRYPIGGHLHFGLPNIQGAAIDTKYVFQNRIARILDELVAVPLVRIDTPMPGERRTKLGYGKFQDVRTFNYKFEWRVPSGIWLVHPTLAFAVLSISKAVVEECWKRYEDRDCDKKFMVETARKDNLLTSFGCLETEKIRSLVNGSKASDVGVDLVLEIQKKIRTMSTYPMYKEGINDFFRLCSATKATPTRTQLLLKRGWLEEKSFK